jgi:hypothetical protein
MAVRVEGVPCEATIGKVEGWIKAKAWVGQDGLK